MNRLLLCTDLDRTLLPNGSVPESPQARKKFTQLAAHPQVTLVYVTGRHKQLVEQAITEYQLPLPNFVIADVGSMIYEIADNEWRYLNSWEERISRDWQGKSIEELDACFAELTDLKRQEPSKQNTYKLSYYVSLECDATQLITVMQKILAEKSLVANLIWSIDEQKNIGLLDILPHSAGKRQAIEFLMQKFHFDITETVFSGDSGNDLCVMSSAIQSVLVANAEKDVRDAAVKQAEENNLLNTLYLAQGNFMGMNGNYSAGILEGVVHYIPQAADWIQDKI